jgi:hypothetical protein
VESATAEEIAIARPMVKKVMSESDMLWDAIAIMNGVNVRSK